MMKMKYEAPSAECVSFQAIDIVMTSEEEEKDVLVTWGSLQKIYDEQSVDIFE